MKVITKFVLLLVFIFLPLTLLASWTELSSGVTHHFASVHFVNADTGLVCGTSASYSGVIMKTTDGGSTWNAKIESGYGSFYELYFVNNDTGYAVASQGKILRTYDCGDNWTDLTSGVSSYLSAVFFVNESVGYVGGGVGVILKTTDGGDTWTPLTSGVTHQINQLYFTHPDTGWAVGSTDPSRRFILKTTDGGATWTEQLYYDYGTLTTVFFTDGKHGHAGGGSGRYYNTSDGGATWTLGSPLIDTSELQSMIFMDQNNGYAVGWGGRIVQSTDAGITWTEITSPTTGNLQDIQFPTAGVGYIVGRDGIILKSSEVVVPDTTGTIKGKITDATTGSAIEKAIVTVAGLADTTDNLGQYEIANVPEGKFEAEFSGNPTTGNAPLAVQFSNLSTLGTQTVAATASGYSNYLNNQVVINRGETTVLDFSLSPQIASGGMRFVLNWAETPDDLDSYLKTPDIEGSSYTVYYLNQGSATSAPYATLDYDVTEGYGPETVTIAQFYEGTYYYYIHRFSSGDLTQSQGVVQIYTDQGLINTIYAPAAGTGEYWNVCTIDGATKAVTIVNEIVDVAPAGASPILHAYKEKPNIMNAASAATWYWNFGDGNSSTEKSPSHTYTSAGTYTVSLELTDGSNNNTETKTDYITVDEGTGEIISTSTGGNWTETTTWVGGVVPTADDDVVIDGTVLVNASVSCKSITINENDTLTNAGNGFGDGYDLTVKGDINNNGVITDNASTNDVLWLYVEGNLKNNGKWQNKSVNFSVTENRIIAGTTEFNMQEVAIKDSTINVTIDDEVTFNSVYINGNRGTFDIPLGARLKLVDTDSVGWNHVDDLKINGGGELYMSDEVYLNEGCEVSDIKLTGTVEVEDYVDFKQNIVNDGILQQHNSNYPVGLDLREDFVNNGVIRDNPNDNDHFEIYAYKNFINNGSWSNRYTYLRGATDHKLTLNQEFSGMYLIKDDTTTSLSFTIEPTFVNTIIDLNNGKLIIAPNIMAKFVHKTGYWGEIKNAKISGGGTIIMTGGYFLNEGCVLNNINLAGLVEVGYDVIFKAGVVNIDTLQQHPNNYSVILYLQDAFVNKGLIRTNPDDNDYFIIETTSHITNFGTWDNDQTYFNGTNNQSVLIGSGLSCYIYMEAMMEGASTWQWYKDGVSDGMDTDEIQNMDQLTDADYGVYMCSTDIGDSRTITVSESPEQLAAAFSSNVTSGIAPLTVSFKDESGGAPTSWTWKFGDGHTSTEPNPVHQYLSPSTFTVSLTVKNATQADSVTKVDYITVKEGVISTTDGGYWDAESTWVAGVVPTEKDDAVIDGNVFVTEDAICNNLYINSGDTLRTAPDGFYDGNTLTVLGGVTNNGVILDNDPSNDDLWMKVAGHISNNGVWANRSVELTGNIPQHIRATTEFKMTELFHIDSTASVVADSNLTFNSVYINFARAAFEIPKGKRLSLIDPDKLGYNQIDDTKITGGGELFMADEVYLNEGTEVSNMTLKGTVEVEDYVLFKQNIINEDTLQQHNSNYPVGLNLLENFVNNGVIRDNPNDNDHFELYAYKNVVNNAVWKNSRLYFKATQPETLTLNNEFECRWLEKTDTTEALVFDVDSKLVNTWVEMNNAKLLIPVDIQLTMTNDNEGTNCKLVNAVIGGGGSIYMENGAFIDAGSVVSDIQLKGTAEVGYDVTFKQNVVIHDTLQQHSNNYPTTLTLADDFTNNGIIRDNPDDNDYFIIDAYKNVTNNAVWNNRTTYFKSSQQQTLTLNKEFSGYWLEKTDTTNALVLDVTSKLVNTWVEMNNSELLIPVNIQLTMTNDNGGTNCKLVNAMIGGGGTIHMENGAFIDAGSVVSDIQLKGTAEVGYDVIFKQNVVNIDTLQQHPNNYPTRLYLFDDFVNHGVVRDNPDDNDYLIIESTSNISNNGVWMNWQTDINGASDQTINIGNGMDKRVNIYAMVEGASSYQWMKNGVNIEDETGGLIDFAMLTSDDWGAYKCSTDVTESRTITIAGKAPELVAGFTADVTTGEAPLTVEFTDSSRGDPTSWFWTFGDGDTSTVQNPVHEYKIDGVFDVMLIVSDGTISDTLRKVDYITVTIPEKSNSLAGTVTDATNGNPIVGAVVSIAGLSGTTDSSGHYLITNIPLGEWDAEFSGQPTAGEAPLTVHFTDLSKPGTQRVAASAQNYLGYENEQVVIIQDEVVYLDISLSPELATGNMRFVLNWDKMPTDLDSHLETPEIDGSVYDVYFNDQGSETESPYVTLDYDVTEGYGPETITIYKLMDGTYKYYIHNYSDDATLIASKAVVQIYGESGLLETVNVPNSGEGTYWHVCDIDGATGDITVVNQIQSTAPGAAGKYRLTALVSKSPKVQIAQSGVNFEWDFGDGEMSNEQNPEHIYTESGTYTVSLTISDSTNSAGEIKVDYITVEESGDYDLLLSQGFEDGEAEGWIVVDNDGNQETWMIYKEEPPADTLAHTGTHSAGVAFNETGNDDWLISPSVKLTDREKIEFSFYAKSHSYDFLEDFNVWLSTTGRELADFTVRLDTVRNAAPYWWEYKYDISEFAGQAVYLAVQCVSLDDYYLFVDDFKVVGSGVSGVLAGKSLIPEKFALYQNYPNPFNPETAIIVDVPEVADVKVTIYNLLGQTVKVLVDNELQPGVHHFNWNATNKNGAIVNSGVYLYKIETEKFKQVRKMIMLK